MPNVELLQMTISEMAPKIQSKEVSPVELTEAALAAADKLQPTINSFMVRCTCRARLLGLGRWEYSLYRFRNIGRTYYILG